MNHISFIGKAGRLIMSGVLVAAFAPAIVAPDTARANTEPKILDVSSEAELDAATEDADVIGVNFLNDIEGDFHLPKDRVFSIDLRGHALTSTTGATITVDYDAQLEVFGDLEGESATGTIGNSSAGSSVVSNVGKVYLDGVIVEKETAGANVVNHGTMQFDGVTMGREDAASPLVENGYAPGVSVDGDESPSLTVNSGTYTSASSFAESYGPSALNVKGGTFAASALVSSKTGGATLGSVTISGGDMSGVDTLVDADDERLAAGIAGISITGGKMDYDAMDESYELLKQKARAGQTLSSDEIAYFDATAAAMDDEESYVTYAELMKKIEAEKEAAARAEADKKAAADVQAMIDALPAAEDVTLADRDAVEAAWSAYRALSDEAQELVNMGRLNAASSAIADLEADEAVAVTAQIDALPAAEDVTLENRAAVEAARAAYDALTPKQQSWVTNSDALVAAEAKIAELEKAEASAKAVAAASQAIEALPATGDVALTDKAAIDSARATYDALTDEQKALVDEAPLLAAESKLVELEKAEADKKAAEEQAAKDAAGKPAGQNEAPSSPAQSSTEAAKAGQDGQQASGAEAESLEEASFINTKSVTAEQVKQAAALGATTVTIGPKAKKIAKGAFKGTKIKTIVVKSKKLTKKGVKNSLKGSKVKTVKVAVGSKKANKKLVKKYKGFFTAKNCGRKGVKVK